MYVMRMDVLVFIKSLVDGKYEIEEGMCSLGQNMDYYRHLKEVFGDEYRHVLYALRDCSVFPYFAKHSRTVLGYTKNVL